MKRDSANRDARRCLVIGEVGLAHDGSLGAAHAFVDAIADAGADAIKFQTHIAEFESTAREQFRVQFSKQDPTRYHYWQRTAFTEAQWRGLAEHARNRRLRFLSSAFSVEAVDLLTRVGVDAWKIGSGEVSNVALLCRVARESEPIYLSSGMSDLAELDQAVGCLRKAGKDPLIFQCTSVYPCPAEKVGLNVLDELRDRYKCHVGLSDHSGTIYPSLAAAARGAAAVEVHVCFSRAMFGPDVPASLTLEELATLTKGVDFIGRMLASPVDKSIERAALEPMRLLFSKSVVVSVPLAAGQVIGAEHLALKKPGDGLPASALEKLVGRRLRRALRKDDQLRFEDVE